MDNNLVESMFNDGTTTNSELIEGNMIYALKTAQNEYGLILIKSISNASVSIGGCHFKK